mmetsp:Transcript_68718/g.206116  ORF Transcript_68718/g.206116 Transcript_68718/m.206116 type:complete len:232 (-) Transcript_68718:452-1147(-)
MAAWRAPKATCAPRDAWAANSRLVTAIFHSAAAFCSRSSTSPGRPPGIEGESARPAASSSAVGPVPASSPFWTSNSAAAITVRAFSAAASSASRALFSMALTIRSASAALSRAPLAACIAPSKACCFACVASAERDVFLSAWSCIATAALRFSVARAAVRLLASLTSCMRSRPSASSAELSLACTIAMMLGGTPPAVALPSAFFVAAISAAVGASGTERRRSSAVHASCPI